MSAPATILDMCCGSRMFWFDKSDERAIFSDIRKEGYTLRNGRRLITSGKNLLGVPRKRHRTGRADRHQHIETTHKKSCTVALRPPATKITTGKDGGKHHR